METSLKCSDFIFVFIYCIQIIQMPPLFGGKNSLNLQLSFNFQSSIFYHFNNSYFTAIVKVLFLIHHPLTKHSKARYILYVLYNGSVFSSNLAGFGLKNFYSISWATMRALWVSLTNINSTHKTQSSKEKWW